jgi:ABC-2 type transport system ATP-binding protein
VTTVTLEAGAPIGASPPSAAIVTSGLTKRFRGGQVAVDALDLAVPRGSVFGFLGPNGSGKTTTIRMLLGLVAPTEGECSLLGLPRADALPRVGALVEGPAFYPYLSGEANLRRFDAADPTAPAGTAGQRIGQALERVGLGAAAGKRYRNYSLGMRQRLAIAAALLGPRELLILDEPTNGLDPQGTREVRALVKEEQLARAPPSSSPPTCWPRSSRCARTRPSCAPASWSRRAPWPRSAAAAPPVSGSTPPTPPTPRGCSPGSAWRTCGSATT